MKLLLFNTSMISRIYVALLNTGPKLEEFDKTSVDNEINLKVCYIHIYPHFAFYAYFCENLILFFIY